MRSVEFSPKAEAARTELPLHVRREINAAIRGIAERPDWGATANRYLATKPADSGLIADLSVREYVIVYRIRSADNAVWIQAIAPIFIG